MVIGHWQTKREEITDSRAYQELAIHTIFKILIRASLYNTLLRIESSVTSGPPRKEAGEISKSRRTKPINLSNQKERPEKSIGVKGFSKKIHEKMNRLMFLAVICALTVAIHGLPQQPKSKRPTPVFKQNQIGGLQLPDNATLIRENIVDTFSCKDRIYGYYADIENDCQIFHVCLPQSRNVARYSFICPAETVFNQATFVCTRTEESIPCEESEKYYNLNEEIGKEEENIDEETTNDIPVNAEVEPISVKPFTRTSRVLSRQRSSQNH
ncbi:hypothetical protein KPH14_001842 [Odynerus spinipes]|uniref:Chitin-binding type-2 domain-containing protein n=1 Tax=Odynerus spinipes TaxID=1348599 RepID=A0AAD9VVY7_9HYME|nr:hypothetical protein KPH14_001842 [Odynerus spinipes]